MPFRQFQGLPSNIKPPIRGVEYAPLDELLIKYANDEEKLKFLRKYEQYFKAITTDTSYNQSLLNVTNENSDYLKKHKLWFPYLKIEALNLPKLEDLAEKSEKESEKQEDKQISDESINNTTTTKEKLRELTAALETNFFNYLHIPYMFGEAPIPPLINHVSNDLDGDIYTFGGLTLMDQNEQNEMLHYLTDDGLIPLENVQVNMNYNLPVPLNKDILKSPFMKPSPHLYVYSTCSQTLSRPELLTRITKRPKGKNAEELNEVPPGLIGCHSCVISKRHIFYYGGFEIKTTITKRDTSTTIDKEIVMNNRAWILDTSSLKFKHVTLSVHPTMTTRFPVAIPRFGHLSMSVTLEEMNQQKNPSLIISSKETPKSSIYNNIYEKQFPNPALVYIIGGYKQSTNSKDFIPLNDIWKVELFINYEDKKSNYITFSESSIAYPIGDFDLDERNYDDFASSKHSGQSDHSSDEEGDLANTRSRKSSSASSLSQQAQAQRPPAIFSGIIKNDNIDWPDPRGFFAGSLFDNSQLYKDTVNPDGSEPLSPSLGSTNLAHPVPKTSSTIPNLNDVRGLGDSTSPLGNTVTYAGGTTTYSSPPQAFSPSEASRQRRKSQSQSHSQRITSADPFRKMSPNYSSTVNSSHGASTFSGVTVNKTLIIHGGSTLQYRVVTNSKSGKVQKFTKKRILSDMWWLNLADEKWRCIPTFLTESEATSNGPDTSIRYAAVKRCGHTALKLDNRYMVLMGGALEIDFKNEAYFNDYHKDTSSEPKTSATGSENYASSGSSEHPAVSSEESNVEDIQELALKIGSMEVSPQSNNLIPPSDETSIQKKTSPTSAHDNYHRMLILDTETQCWRISRYFHNFNLRARNYTDTQSTNPVLTKKINDSLRKAFFSNICGSAVTFDSKIFIIGGECRPHLPEELTNLKSTSLAEADTKIMFSSVCVFEMPLGK